LIIAKKKKQRKFKWESSSLKMSFSNSIRHIELSNKLGPEQTSA
jgi:hypothetical protein